MSQIPNLTLNNGVTMPCLGLGVFGLSGSACYNAVSAAIGSGCRMVDTAQHYHNETEVGEAVRNSHIDRRELFITTKLWNDSHGYDRTLRAFDASLEKLGLDYIDLYLIHFPQPKHELYLQTWRALEKIYQERRVRAIGVSNFNIEHLQQLIDRQGIMPAVNQIEIHPKLQQTDLLEFHQQHSIVTIACSPLGRGDFNHPEIDDIAETHGHTPAQVVLRWHASRGVVTIPKSASPARFKENSDIFGFDVAPEEISSISGLEKGHRLGHNPDTFHTELSKENDHSP